MDNDVMVDIETLGIGADAYILSIGACTFDGEHTFYKVVASGQNRKIDVGTVHWWLSQSPQAQEVITKSRNSRVSLPSALALFTDWLTDCNFSNDSSNCIWSHGATFDLPILDNAFTQVGMSLPWKYWQARDTRTVIELHEQLVGKKDKPPREGVHHNALDDALYQAKWMIQLIEELTAK